MRYILVLITTLLLSSGPSYAQQPQPPSRDEILGNLTTKGLYIRFYNVRHVGSNVEGDVSIEWEERIAGVRVVLIRGEYHFNITGRVTVAEGDIPIAFGISVHVKADVFLETNPNKICGEVRGTFPGGNVGDIKCSLI